MQGVNPNAYYGSMFGQQGINQHNPFAMINAIGRNRPGIFGNQMPHTTATYNPPNTGATDIPITGQQPRNFFDLFPNQVPINDRFAPAPLPENSWNMPAYPPQFTPGDNFPTINPAPTHTFVADPNQYPSINPAPPNFAPTNEPPYIIPSPSPMAPNRPLPQYQTPPYFIEPMPGFKVPLSMAGLPGSTNLPTRQPELNYQPAPRSIGQRF